MPTGLGSCVLRGRCGQCGFEPPATAVAGGGVFIRACRQGDPSPPGAAEQIASAAKAAFEFVSSGGTLVSMDVLLARQAACAQCEDRLPGSIGDYCSRCGCWLKFKTTLPAETCPAGKWPT